MNHIIPSRASAPDSNSPHWEFAQALIKGLSTKPRQLPCKFFYDETGSKLFDAICDLPEYYPTRTEFGILRDHAAEIAAQIGPQAEIVEFGAGSGRKVRLLLDALERPARYTPIDISGDHLTAAAAAIATDYPALDVAPVIADYTKPFGLPAAKGNSHRVGFFPGSTIGNFTPEEALHFLRNARGLLQGGGLLIGVDLVKQPAILHAAYNDAAGVTAAFNLNLLARARRDLGIEFKLDSFSHYACYNPEARRVEMYLICTRAHRLELFGRVIDFAEGEAIHTENSYKYTKADFRTLAAAAGFHPGPVWTDSNGLFSLHWLQATEAKPW
jgi:dimethylhistidine N-methyltransferase